MAWLGPGDAPVTRSFRELSDLVDRLDGFDLEALDTPLRDVPLAKKIRRAVYSVYEPGESLWDLLHTADDVFAGRQSRRIRDDLLVSVRGVLFGKMAKVAAPKPAPRPTDPRPKTASSVAKWAAERSLGNALETRLSTLDLRGPTGRRWNWRHLPVGSMTIGDFLAHKNAAALRYLDDLDDLREAVWRHLDYAAECVREGLAEEAAEGLERRPAPEDEPARMLFKRLLDRRRSIRESIPALPRRRRPDVTSSTLIPGSPPLLRLQFVSDAWEPDVQADLVLETSSDDAMEVRCSCVPVTCMHRLIVVDAAIRVLLADRTDQTRVNLIKEVSLEPWQRTLRALDDSISAASEQHADDAVLWWGLDRTAMGWRVSPYVQKRGKRGTLLKPKKVGPAAVPERSATEPADADLIELCASLNRAGDSEYDPFHKVWVSALRQLCGHPRVFFGKYAGQAWRVESQAATVSLGEGPGGLELRPAIGDRTYAANAFLDLIHTNSHGRALILVGEKDSTIAIVDLTTQFVRLVQGLEHFGNTVPEHAREEVVKRLPALGRIAPVTLSPSLGGREVVALRRLVFVMSREGTAALTVEVRVRAIDGGPLHTPGLGPDQVVSDTPDRELVFARRDRGAEPVWARSLLSQALPKHKVDERWQIELSEIDEAIDLVDRLRKLDVECVWPHGEFKLARQATQSDLRLSIADRGDWFGLDGGIDVDGHRISIAVMLEAIRAERRYVALDDNHFVQLDNLLRERLRRVAPAVYKGRRGLEVSPMIAQDVEALGDGAAVFEASKRWRNLLDNIATATELDPVLPSDLKADLRDYQREGFRWMTRLASWGAGAVLADDMGLGKTVQALAVIVDRASEGPAMVIAPTSVTFNWKREAERFAPGLRLVSYRGADRRAHLDTLGPGDLLIASYALVQRDADAFAKRSISTLVIDEAQTIKNPRTLRSRAIRAIDASFIAALTGTPIENHLGELWALFAATCPGLFGSWERFRERFAAPIERDGDRKRAKELSRLIRPFVLRRTKAEVATELPPRTEVQVDVTLSSRERDLYEDVRLSAVAQLAKLDLGDAAPQGRFQVLAALTRLRQLSCRPRLLDDASRVPSSKHAKLMALLAELIDEGQRALVFSQFTRHLALVRAALDDANIAYEYLDGSTPAAARAEAIDRFQNGVAPVFLLSIKAGGTGLNLTAADNVVHLDPWWNPAVEDQATDRAHRIGQERPVTVYRLVSRGTIEETILSLHEKKRALMADVLEGTDRAQALSTSELADLIHRGTEPEPDADDGDDTTDG